MLLDVYMSGMAFGIQAADSPTRAFRSTKRRCEFSSIRSLRFVEVGLDVYQEAAGQVR